MSSHLYSSQHNLYQPDEFKDNCGFGLIAHTHGEASHDLVETAIHSLSCMTHRGGVAADGKTGDGCGLLMAMPKDFFKKSHRTMVLPLIRFLPLVQFLSIWIKI